MKEVNARSTQTGIHVRELTDKHCRRKASKNTFSIDVGPSGCETQREERCYIIIPGFDFVEVTDGLYIK